MFIVTSGTREQGARRALTWLATKVPGEAKPVHALSLGDDVVVWAGTQANQNLHVFDDGMVIGVLRLGEAPSPDPVRHHGPVLRPSSPITATVVHRDPRRVEPLGITSVFHSRSATSDRQLLLAIMDDLRPSAVGVALITGLGYFPGNETLFSELTRIPLGHDLDRRDHSVHRVISLVLPKPDDEAMVDRLASLVEEDGHQTIGLTGGIDSRFVLGVLNHRGVRPTVARFDEGMEGEREVVRSMIETLKLPERSAGRIAQADRQWAPMQQVVLTDAQIYAAVPQWGQLRDVLAPTDAFHTGHFGDSIIKNWFKSAWKKPDPRRDLWETLLASLAPGKPSDQGALRAVQSRPALLEHLRPAMAYQRDYVELRTQKQLTNWFGYMNRALRWSPALVGDISFWANPVFLLGDLQAQLLGIATPAWGNFHHDRARQLNHRLLRTVTDGYAGGVARLPRRGPAGAIDKLTYEYVVRLQTKRRLVARAEGQRPTYDHLLPDEPTGWDDLFTVEPDVAVASGSTPFKRGALTSALVLALLAEARAAPDPAPR